MYEFHKANGPAAQAMLPSLLEQAGEKLDKYKARIFGNAAAVAYEGAIYEVIVVNCETS